MRCSNVNFYKLIELECFQSQEYFIITSREHFGLIYIFNLLNGLKLSEVFSSALYNFYKYISKSRHADSFFCEYYVRILCNLKFNYLIIHKIILLQSFALKRLINHPNINFASKHTKIFLNSNFTIIILFNRVIH